MEAVSELFALLTSSKTYIFIGVALVVELALVAAWLYLSSRRAGGTLPSGTRLPSQPTVLPVMSPLIGALTLVGAPDRRYPFNLPGCTIGRARDNSLAVEESFPRWQTVSRRHAVIFQQGDQAFIEDLGSRNGIKINDRPTAKNLLRDGWKVTIGGIEFTFHAASNGDGRHYDRAIPLS